MVAISLLFKFFTPFSSPHFRKGSITPPHHGSWVWLWHALVSWQAEYTSLPLDFGFLFTWLAPTNETLSDMAWAGAWNVLVPRGLPSCTSVVEEEPAPLAYWPKGGTQHVTDLKATCNLDLYPAKPRLDLPNSSHATDKWERINACCLRSPGFGVVCYAAFFWQ